GAGTRFTINHELRAAIQVWKTTPSLPTLTVAATLPVVLAELRRQRKENHDGIRQAKWNPAAIHKRYQHDQLNYVETELARLVDLLSPMPPPSAPVASSTRPSVQDGPQETPPHEHHENGRHGQAADTGDPH